MRDDLGHHAGMFRRQVAGTHPARLLGHGLDQGIATGKMPEWRPRRNPGPPGRFTDADRVRAALVHQLQRSIDQDPPEITMVIRL